MYARIHKHTAPVGQETAGTAQSAHNQRSTRLLVPSAKRVVARVTISIIKSVRVVSLFFLFRREGKKNSIERVLVFQLSSNVDAFLEMDDKR